MHPDKNLPVILISQIREKANRLLIGELKRHNMAGLAPLVPLSMVLSLQLFTPMVLAYTVAQSAYTPALNAASLCPVRSVPAMVQV